MKGGERVEGWRRGSRWVKVGLRELEGRKLEGVGMRKGGREGWMVKKGGERERARDGGGWRAPEGRRDGRREGGYGNPSEAG